MGQRDSSLTRVQPVMRQILASNAADALPRLLRLGSRAVDCSLERIFAPMALLENHAVTHCFEYSATAPPGYLKKLLDSRDRLQRAVNANPGILKSSKNPNVEKMRRRLLDGDREAIADGQARIDRGHTRTGDGTWWVLEGTTKVDCAIFADNATIFIEGKRTERKLTDRVTWDLDRNQVFRNLDALREMRAGDDDFFVLLIVEEGSPAANAAGLLDAGYNVALASWPHLDDEHARELYDRHYLGFTTWQAVASEFNITLLDTVDDLARIATDADAGIE